MPLTNMEIVIAGRLKKWTQGELTALLTERGATVRKSCSPNTTLLIVGTSPGQRVQKAKALGISQMLEANLPHFLNVLATRNATQKEERLADILAELRGLLDKPQEESTWFLLCLLFDAWPKEEDIEVGIAYAVQHLENWPPALRTAPENWLDDARLGSANPRMALVQNLNPQSNILEFPPHDSSGITQELNPTLGDLGLKTLLDSGYIDQVVHISLPAQDISDTGIEALSNHEGLQALRTLHLEGNTYTMQSMAALCDAPFVPQLESLRIQSPRLKRPEIDALRKTPALQHIQALELHQSIIETAWSGHDSDDDEYEYYFYPDGHVLYTNVGTGNIWDEKKDQWRQLGDQIVISTTHGYATYTGTMTDFEIIGSSTNVTERKWTWKWTFLPDGPPHLEVG